ncbi:hypothetical protein AOLI_G00148930 [Acnodon oligacanthus]
MGSFQQRRFPEGLPPRYLPALSPAGARLMMSRPQGWRSEGRVHEHDFITPWEGRRERERERERESESASPGQRGGGRGRLRGEKRRKRSGRRTADAGKVSARPFGSRERATKLQQVRAAGLFPDSAYRARRWRFARAVPPQCLPVRTYFEDFVEVVGSVSGWWLELVQLTLCTRLHAGLREHGRVSNAVYADTVTLRGAFNTRDAPSHGEPCRRPCRRIPFPFQTTGTQLMGIVADSLARSDWPSEGAAYRRWAARGAARASLSCSIQCSSAVRVYVRAERLGASTTLPCFGERSRAVGTLTSSRQSQEPRLFGNSARF